MARGVRPGVPGIVRHAAGERLGMLTLVRKELRAGVSHWECLCDCGTSGVYRVSELFCSRLPRISCGCVRRPRPVKSLVERFWSKVDKENGPIHPVHGRCWIWTGSVDTGGGYGLLTRPGNREERARAHRVSFELDHGVTLDESRHVLHRCDNPPCVRPDHLFEGNDIVNVADKVAKGRQSRGEHRPNARLTETQVSEIRSRFAAGGVTKSDLAREYGVTRPCIRLVVDRIRWTHVA